MAKRKAMSSNSSNKKRKVSKTLKKTIKSVVNKALNKVVETKRYSNNTQQSYNNRQVRISNPLYSIPVGDTIDARDGQEIFVKSIGIKTECLNGVNENVTHHVAVIMSTNIDNGFQQPAFATQYFSNSGSHSDNWKFDSDKCTVLSHKKFKTWGATYPNITAERNGNISMYVRINKKFKYNSATGYMLGKNLFVLYWASIPTGGALVTSMSSDIQVYFKA